MLFWMDQEQRILMTAFSEHSPHGAEPYASRSGQWFQRPLTLDDIFDQLVNTQRARAPS